MTNKLTDERIAELFECVDMCDDMSIDENADMASALRELQQRRLADKNCFMYGIVNPDGQAHMDEFCVSSDIGLLETEVAALNSSEGTDGYRVVALYTALPLTNAEREELQERSKFDQAKLINKFYERYPLDTFKSDSERAGALGYYMAGAELQRCGEFIVYEDANCDE